MSKISNWKEWDGRADAELAALYVEQRLDRDALAAMMGRSLSSISNRVSRFKMTEREKCRCADASAAASGSSRAPGSGTASAPPATRATPA